VYRLNPVDPQLESASFQPLSLSSEKLVSKFAFKFNVYRYSEGVALKMHKAAPRANFINLPGEAPVQLESS
jgi:hypothetical protein